MATLSLNAGAVQQPRAAINRLHILFHSIAILALLYYRASRLFHIARDIPILPWILISTSELILSFIWFLTQAFRWRPVSRAVFQERLPADEDLPGVDVFICTADPKKEPTLEVMNTVLSAMSLDYPPEKLAVYLSDDGGSSITLNAIREAASFGRSWIPFCREYGIKTRCPEAYFSSLADDDRVLRSDGFRAEEEEIMSKYELFKKLVATGGESGEENNLLTGKRRPALIELRVSGIISNSPFTLVLDCDMYCSDPTSAKQAMCFHLDPEISPSLAFVQFPQMFYNVSKNDIYDGQARSAYKTKWQGMDGLSGPVLSGTGYYLKRVAIYGSPKKEDAFLLQPEKTFGSSKEFISSLRGSYKHNVMENGQSLDALVLQEARLLASCAFETDTQWGQEASSIGFSYNCLLESTFSGYLLHCKGWKSAYCFPSRPSFLGCATIDMKDALVQQMKWSSGLFQVGLSRFSPLTYGMSRMSILQSMCYGYFTFLPLFSIAFLIYATIPQLCLLKCIPLYPKVSNPWFAVFAMVYISSLCQHLYEVLSSSGSVRTFWNEQRIWMIKSVTASLFGCLDVFMKWVGIQKANYRLTNKAVDKEKLEKYEKGKFDFQGAAGFMVPLITLVVLNMVCFIGGVRRVIIGGTYDEMFGQLFLSFFILVLSYPVIEGMVTMKGKGRL
ncbi:hypothetical protein HHK36_026865 [Tetracentron sinense]|uniref:Uncharacterized protein n=1 Tax=Tetracentron sinense TaxID=13715 RepID=A0A834YFT2_TETSI|nr:hypothetical protein HHK36_026865 [Tetracentron sinense]